MPVTGDDGVLPLTYVSRHDAQAFCAANGVRLPTEVEWEAAARGGDDRLWPWGDELPGLDARDIRAGHRRAVAGRVASGGSRAVRRARPGGQRLRVDGRRRRARRLVPQRAGRAALLGPPPDAPRGARSVRRLPRRRRRAAPRRSTGSTCRPATTRSAAIPGETRQRLVDVDAFELARTPVTNAQYERFVAESGATAPPHWPAPGDHPVTFVDWFEASAFCAWAGGRLPTEAEWEKAARGTDGRTYPWGDEEDEGRAAVGGRHEARHHGAGRLAPGRREPLRSPRHGRKRLGMDVDRVPAGRAGAARRLVREPGPRLGALRDAQPQPPGPPPGPHRLSSRERSDT